MKGLVESVSDCRGALDEEEVGLMTEMLFSGTDQMLVDETNKQETSSFLNCQQGAVDIVSIDSSDRFQRTMQLH